MSESATYLYALSAERRLALNRARWRENAVRFLRGYENAVQALRAQCLAEFIPAELTRVEGELAVIRANLDTAPERARDVSMQVGPEIARLPALARMIRDQVEENRRQEERRRAEERTRCSAELARLLAEGLAAFTDPVVRDFAREDLQSLRQEMAGRRFDSAAELQTVRAKIAQRLQTVRGEAEARAAAWKTARAQAIQAEAQQTLVGIHEQVLAEEAQDEPDSLGEVLTQLRAYRARLSASEPLDPRELSKHLSAASAQADAIVLDERARKETVRALVTSLQESGFVLIGKPQRHQDAQHDEVVVVARRPNGNQAEVHVQLDGNFAYRFDHYEGTACQNDLETLLPRLQEIYGVQLSDKRVLWSNPDRLSASSRPLEGDRNRHGNR